MPLAFKGNISRIRKFQRINGSQDENNVTQEVEDEDPFEGSSTTSGIL